MSYITFGTEEPIRVMSRRTVTAQSKPTNTSSSRSTDTSTEQIHNSESESNSISIEKSSVDFTAFPNMSFGRYQKMFNAIYQEYYSSRKISTQSVQLIAA